MLQAIWIFPQSGNPSNNDLQLQHKSFHKPRQAQKERFPFLAVVSSQWFINPEAITKTPSEQLPNGVCILRGFGWLT
jgi:hypothetical protein